MAAELRRLRLAEEKAAELAAALTKRCELCFDEVSVEQVGSLMCPNEQLGIAEWMVLVLLYNIYIYNIFKL